MSSQKLLIPFLGLLFLVGSSLFTTHQEASAMPGLTAPSDARVFQGTVVETMNAAGYTYLLLSGNDKQIWVAIPESTIKTGETVNYLEGMVMENFTSKTLNRTFDTIIFSGGLVDRSPSAGSEAKKENDTFETALMAEHGAAQKKPVTVTPKQVSGGSTGAIVPFEELSVEKSQAPNGYTIVEIFTGKKELAGKKVQVRAKVVKFSPLIMGKNWVHLQDGTGNPMQNSHDLVVTTNDTVEVGTIVVLEGILSTDKDFGAGYKYPAIVEQAAIVK